MNLDFFIPRLVSHVGSTTWLFNQPVLLQTAQSWNFIIMGNIVARIYYPCMKEPYISWMLTADGINRWKFQTISGRLYDHRQSISLWALENLEVDSLTESRLKLLLQNHRIQSGPILSFQENNQAIVELGLC